jgi:hypothetical protein
MPPSSDIMLYLMDERSKLEIDQLYRTVNVLRRAVTELQNENAAQRRQLHEFHNWSNRFARAVKEHYDHQKAEIDELYRWANVTAKAGEHKTRRLDHISKSLNSLTNTCWELEDQVFPLMDRLFPKHHAIMECFRKLIGNPSYETPPFDLYSVKKRP